LGVFRHSVEVDCDICHTFSTVFISMLHSSSNRDLNLYTSLNIDDDLLDNLGRGVETEKSVLHLTDRGT